MTPRKPRPLSPVRAYADIGRAIVARRVDLDITRREVAGAIGLQFWTLRAIESGRPALSEDTLAPIFAALGLRIILRDDARNDVACATYREIIVALIERRHALGMSQEAINFAANLQDGYCNKIEADIRRLGPVSLPALLGALRLEMFVEARPSHRWRAPHPIDFGVLRGSYIILPAPEAIAATIPSTIEASPL